MKLSRRSALALAGGALASPLMRGAGIASAQGLTSIKAAGVPEDSAVPVLWGIQSGIFRRHGLDVSLEAARSGAAIAASVAGGAYQIGKSSLAALIAAHVHGVPFVLIAPAAIYDSSISTVALLVKADSPMRVPADLNGKTIAVSSINDVYEIATKAWVDQHGGDSSKVRLVEMPFPEMGPALRRGTIAAAPIAQPSLTVAQRAGGIRRLEPNYMEVYSKHFMMGGWFATAPWIAAHRPVVSKFVGAIYTTARWANTHLNESALILAKYAKMDPALATSIGHTPYGESLTPAMIQPVLDTALKYGGLEHPLKAGDVIARV